MTLTIHPGHVLETLRLVASDSVQCIVTSPPYWGLRDYGTPPVRWPAVAYEPMPGVPFTHHVPAGEDSLGLEPTLEAFLGHLVAIFRECRRVLKPDGVCWVNMGDGYNGYMANHRGTGLEVKRQQSRKYFEPGHGLSAKTLKNKDLIGQPWRVAFALQADGWFLRQDVIWHKPNPMPESCRDRCTKAHEYLFLLTKSERYYWDKSAMAEKCSEGTHPRRAGNGYKMPDGWDTGEGGHGSFHRQGREKGKTPGKNSRIHVTRTPDGAPPQNRKLAAHGEAKNNASFDAAMQVMPAFRNKRSVWTVATAPFKEAHFATFPPALILPCILAGSRPGDTVLDPFGGSLTTAAVALDHGRHAIVHELNEDYIDIGQRTRLRNYTPGML